MLLKSAEDELGKGGVLAGRLSAKAVLQASYYGARYAHGLTTELNRKDGHLDRWKDRQKQSPANLAFRAWPGVRWRRPSAWSRSETEKK